MSTAGTIHPKHVSARKIHRGLSGADLRALASRDETTSKYGSPVYTTKVKNRSAKNTYVVENGAVLGQAQKGMPLEKAREIIRQLHASLADRELIQIDRRMGMSAEVPLHCRLFVPVEFARIAYMWHNMLFPADVAAEPDFVSVYVPDWPERIIFLDPTEGYTYICGTDYPGEAKKSMLRQAMFWMKSRGGLGLHAGSKILRVADTGGTMRDVGFLLFGLSGTGKTTLTLHDHGLETPERVVIKQDDVVLLHPDGRAFGTEDGFYIKTEGLEPSQRVLWDAAISPTACFENVAMRSDGEIDFCDTSLTSNGRGVVLRRFIHGTDDGIDLPKANKIVFITRRNDVVPAVARLTPEQGAAFFMLGESIETSAGDPTKAGQAKREVGTNPFIVGPEADEGNRILEFLRRHSDMEAYILNTGSIGAREGTPGKKISIKISTEIMKQIARGGIVWEPDPDWGYEVARSVPGVDLAGLDPRTHYSADEYARANAKLRQEREEWLGQFPGLDPAIPAAIKPSR